MPKPGFFLGIYLLAVSLLAVGLTVSDKRRAVRHRRRIPEATLFGVALCGGAAAMWLAMRAVRHKTLHRRFMWGLPLIAALHLAVVLLLWRLAAR